MNEAFNQVIILFLTRKYTVKLSRNSLIEKLELYKLADKSEFLILPYTTFLLP